MMTIMEAIRQRHSVRQYTDKPLGEDVIRPLEEEIAALYTKWETLAAQLEEARG